MKKLKFEPGFTIIELLVVIIIIAILAAFVIASYNGITSKAQESTVKANLKNAIALAEKYKLDNSTYRVSPSNNVCTLSEIQNIVGSIQGLGGGAACLTHTNAAIAANEWAIAAAFDGENYYTVDSSGVVKFAARFPTLYNFDAGEALCASSGKRRPTISQFQALDAAYYQKYGSRPIAGFSANTHWTRTEDPANSTQGTYISLSNGGSGTSPKTSFRWTVCVG